MPANSMRCSTADNYGLIGPDWNCAMSLSRELRTDRLLLRRWRAEDRAAFAALNADPVVMEHFPSPLSRVASVACVGRSVRH